MANASDRSSRCRVSGEAQVQRSMRLCTLLPAEPARRAVTEYAASRRLRIDEVADMLQIDARVLRSLMERRWVGWEAADEIAVALGCHPYEIWPEWFPPLPDSIEDGAEVAGNAATARRSNVETG